MVKIASAFSALVAVALSGLAVAHPDTYSEAELVKRQEFQTHARRSLAGCQSKLRARGGVVERAIARREALAERARKERGLIAGKYLSAWNLGLNYRGLLTDTHVDMPFLLT